MATPTFLNRMKKELADLERDPPPLVNCYPTADDITQLEAYLNGPPNTPYEKGIFRLDVNMPENYPFDPPMIRFRTPIYHPNIDECGRICASVLKKGKDDQWKPSMNLRTTLLSLHALIGEPNPDDPLDADIAREYQQDYDLFVKKAREHTKKYAVDMPDNLIPDSYTDSTTQTTQTSGIDFDYDLPSSSITDDTSVATSSKPKSKSKLSLSRKKQSHIQSTTSPSSSTQIPSGNSMTSKATNQSDTVGPLSLDQIKVISPQQQMINDDKGSDCNSNDEDQTRQDFSKCGDESTGKKGDDGGPSALDNATVGSRKKVSIEQENVANNDMDDTVVEQPSLKNLKYGPGNEDGMHGQEPNGEKCEVKQSSHEDEATDKDAKTEHHSTHQQGDTGLDIHINDQKKQTRIDKDDVGMQVIYIDLDDDTSNPEQPKHDKATYISSDESDTGEQQATMDVESGSNNKFDQGQHMDEMDGTGQKEAGASGLTSTRTTPIDEIPEVASDIFPKETQIAATTTSAAPPLVTSSTDKGSPPSSGMELNNNSYASDAAQPGTPLKTATTNDMTGWTYSNPYSTQRLAFATNDPLAAEFPAFLEEEEERPITPKRKSKLSLSCKKKPKIT